jgi:hypothetical protein
VLIKAEFIQLSILRDINASLCCANEVVWFALFKISLITCTHKPNNKESELYFFLYCS